MKGEVKIWSQKPNVANDLPTEINFHKKASVKNVRKNKLVQINL